MMSSKIKLISGAIFVLLLIIIGWVIWTIKIQPGPKGAELVTELNFWGINPTNTWINYWTGAIPRFEAQNPGVKVLYRKPVSCGESDIISKLDIAFKGNTAPDVFEGPIFLLALGAEKNWFEPLDRYIAGWKDKKDIIDQAYEDGVYRGKTYGVGFSPVLLPIVYRKDYFKEAGLDPERPPETWEELADCAVKLTKRIGDVVTRSGFNISSDEYLLLVPFVRQNGGNFLTKDGKPAFNTPEWVEALGYFTDLVANKKVNIITDIKEVRAGDSFLQGRAAISQIWSGQLMNLLKNDPSLRDKIGTINMKRKKVSVWSGMVFPFISSGSEHKDLAWKFVQFILSPEEMWQRYKETRCPVVRKSLKDRYIEDYPIINKVIWEGIPIGEGVAKVPWMPKVLEQITRAMQESFHEGKPPAQALNEATERLLKEIDSDPKQMRVY